MTFPVKDWQNKPSELTPVSAEALEDLETRLSGYTDNLADNVIPKSERGTPNGVASLDSGGKINASQLPNSVMDYKGSWNASTNSPSLADGTGSTGDVYVVSTAGTRNLGSGSQTFAIKDWVVYDGATWQKVDNTDDVTSVAGRTGAITLAQSDVTGLVDALGSKVGEEDIDGRISGWWAAAQTIGGEEYSTPILWALTQWPEIFGVVPELNNVPGGFALNPPSGLAIGTCLAHVEQEDTYYADTGSWEFPFAGVPGMEDIIDLTGTGGNVLSATIEVPRAMSVRLHYRAVGVGIFTNEGHIEGGISCEDLPSIPSDGVGSYSPESVSISLQNPGVGFDDTDLIATTVDMDQYVDIPEAGEYTFEVNVHGAGYFLQGWSTEPTWQPPFLRIEVVGETP